MTTAHIHLPDVNATIETGARLAPTLAGGMVVTLAGELGSGKTTLVRGVLRRLGWIGPIKSPSFTLVEQYPLPSLYFFHFDFYRFADPGEWESTGFAEYFTRDSVCLVEWPERVAELLPPRDLAITLAHPARLEDSGRCCTLEAHTEAGERCLRAMAATDGNAKRAS